MKLQILAVGKVRVPYFAAGVDEYLKRIRNYLPIEQIEVPEGTGGDSNGHGTGAISREGEKLAKHLKPGTRLVTLEASGRQLTSEAFSEWLQKEMSASAERIAFVIGGAWGIDKQLSEAAHLRLSLSEMTFPHELARLVLVEQIYRALTLWKGHPYHK